MVTYVAGRMDISQQLRIANVSAEFLGDARSLGQSEQINSSTQPNEFIAGLQIVSSSRCTVELA